MHQITKTFINKQAGEHSGAKTNLKGELIFDLHLSGGHKYDFK